MAQHIELGQQGEQVAGQYLAKKGYKILHRNWRFHKEEIDIIALDGKELVIVEVKTRGAKVYEDPRDSITQKKIRYLVDAAEAYILKNNIDLETRFDVISIKWFGEGKYTIDHRERAFQPPVN